jgi:hypothetical protein
MFSFKASLASALGLALVSSAVPLAHSAAPASAPPIAAPQQVQVVNTSSQPVPVAPTGTTTVTGSVSISGTPSVSIAGTPSVSLSGTPSVSLAGTPSVSLSGTPSVSIAGTIPTTQADRPGQQPMHVWQTVQLAPGQNFNAVAVDVAQPPGTQMVIEHVSIIGGAPVGQYLQARVSVFDPTQELLRHIFPLSLQGTYSNGQYQNQIFAGPTKLYVPKGGSVAVYISRDDVATSSATMTFALSGYFAN